MSEPILDPAYWGKRLALARQQGEEHLAVFRCPLERWKHIEAKHREILARLIEPNHGVIDAACGWGRLLELMPQEWVGDYIGIDLSPNFIALAGHRYPRRQFIEGDLRFPQLLVNRKYDWAICVSFRPMVKRNLGDEAWQEIETNLRLIANRLLYLEYDEHDEGSVE